MLPMSPHGVKSIVETRVEEAQRRRDHQCLLHEAKMARRASEGSRINRVFRPLRWLLTTAGFRLPRESPRESLPLDPQCAERR